VNGPTWRIDDEDGDPGLSGAHQPLLVTGRAMRDALARTWRVWVGAAIIGGLLGLAALLVVPHRGSASTTLLMVHPDPTDIDAMTTDLSLLQTRAVASRVLADLDLEQSPESLLSSVTPTAVNNQVLQITMTGADDADAVARASSLVDNFLTFRAAQLTSISDGLIKGYRSRVDDLQAEVDRLTEEYDALASQPTVDQVRATDILTARANLGSQISTLQRSIEDTSLQTEAAISATHVIDPPEAKPAAGRRQLVLYSGSGAILGGAVAVGTILFVNLTSDRLRRRRDVALALGVPVRVGVGAIPTGRLGRLEAATKARIASLFRGHPVRWTERRRSRNLDALVRGLESALPARIASPERHRDPDRPRSSRRSGPTTLGVAAIDRGEATAAVIRTLGLRVSTRGVPVLLVDLSASGALTTTPGLSAASDGDGPVLRTFRPDGDPTLASGPRKSGRRPAPDPRELGELAQAWDDAQLVLALVELDPGIDLDLLRTWVNRIVPLVSAGRAGGELLTTIGALVEQAGIEMPFALLEGADPSDESLGHAAPPGEGREELGVVESR
jgi:hypothetical protein